MRGTLLTEPEPIDRIFSALGHPIRRRIVAHLAASGDTSISDLAAPFDVTLMAVSKHVKVLTKAGLVSVQREGRIHWCRVVPEALKLARDWVDHYRVGGE